MNVYIHIHNSGLQLDETPAICVDMPFEPQIGDYVWLKESQLETLKSLLVEKFKQDDVLIWSDYLYCTTSIKLNRGDDYQSITKEEFEQDLDFGDAIKVCRRFITLCDDDESIPPGLHIALTKR